MKQIIKMVISYDGSDFYGWQRQPTKRSVQGVIEKTLSKLLKRDIKIDGAGRTDAGVHALGQVASFEAKLPMPIEKFAGLLNNHLPKDIVIKEVSYEDASFHARYSAVGKTYVYQVLQDKQADVFLARTHHHYIYELDDRLMRAACERLKGAHNFESFKASGSSAQNPYREITRCEFVRKGNALTFTFTGNGFLYKMVRILSAFILEIGNRRIDLKTIDEVFNTPSRQYTTKVAPAKGLFLKEVFY